MMTFKQFLKSDKYVPSKDKELNPSRTVTRFSKYDVSDVKPRVDIKPELDKKG